VKLVHASDISPSMILEARNKNIPAGNIRFITADTRELPSMLQSEYDLLFSNFGGLNCLSAEEIKTFATRMAPFISGDGKLALVVMGRKCIWENFLFRWQKDKRVNRRKAVGGVNTNLGGTTFKTYYYSPSELEGLFSVHFRKVQLRPVGLFIPPSYLNPYFENKKGLLRLLNFFERMTGHLPFADYADHYFIVLEKKNPSTGHKL